MAFIPAPNAIRVCLQMEWQGQTVEICIGILKNSAVVSTDLLDVALALEPWRIDLFAPVISSDVTFTQWYLLSLTSATSPSLIVPITVDNTGSSAAGTVPLNVALVTTFQTALRGRSYRGRAYTPGIAAVNLVNPGTFGDAVAEDATQAYAGINAALPTGFVHCVISYQNNNALRSTAARTPVTGYRTEVNADSQRRRLIGRGA